MTWPRVRVDHLMKFAWKVLVPIALINILLASLFVTYALPALKQYGLF